MKAVKHNGILIWIILFTGILFPLSIGLGASTNQVWIPYVGAIISSPGLVVSFESGKVVVPLWWALDGKQRLGIAFFGFKAGIIQSLRSFRRPVLCHRWRLLARSWPMRRCWAVVFFRRRCDSRHGGEVVALELVVGVLASTVPPPCLGCGSESSGMLLGVSSERSRGLLGAVWGPFGSVRGPLGGVLGLPGGLLEASWGPLGGLLGAPWGPLGGPLRPSGGFLGPGPEMSVRALRLGSLLEASWGPLGPSWRPLRPSWGPLGPSWGPLGGLLEASWAVLGASWAVLRRSWGPLWPPWSFREPKRRIC